MGTPGAFCSIVENGRVCHGCSAKGSLWPADPRWQAGWSRCLCACLKTDCARFAVRRRAIWSGSDDVHTFLGCDMGTHHRVRNYVSTGGRVLLLLHSVL